MAVDARPSALWRDCLLPESGETAVVCPPLARPFALGLGTIYGATSFTTAGRGCSRRATATRRSCSATTSTRTWRISALHEVAAVRFFRADLALQPAAAEDADGDGELWAATAALLGRGEARRGGTALRLIPIRRRSTLWLAARWRSAVDEALVAHFMRRTAVRRAPPLSRLMNSNQTTTGRPAAGRRDTASLVAQ
jgi:hypothetical protein